MHQIPYLLSINRILNSPSYSLLRLRTWDGVSTHNFQTHVRNFIALKELLGAGGKE